MSGEAGNDDATKVITGCYGQERTKDLLYVARYQKYKGQLKFLLLADPGLLRGYTIHFYGGDKVGDDKIAQAYVKSIEEAAERRGIKVQLHSRVSRSTLLRHVCVASGQLLWPSTDQNPRAGASPPATSPAPGGHSRPPSSHYSLVHPLASPRFD